MAVKHVDLFSLRWPTTACLLFPAPKHLLRQFDCVIIGCLINCVWLAEISELFRVLTWNNLIRVVKEYATTMEGLEEKGNWKWSHFSLLQVGMLTLSSFTLVAQHAWASTFEIKIENTGTISTFACSSRNHRQNHESGYLTMLFGTVWQRNARKSVQRVPHDSLYSFNQSHYSFMALAASMQFRNDRKLSQWLRRQKRNEMTNLHI